MEVLKFTDARGIRSPGKDVYSVKFSDYLPETLKRDPKMKALAAAVTEQMLSASREIDNVLIYSRIDELPEELIDILAFDMHVDWYDYTYPLSVKRDILKNSVKVHKKMGTKYAVETALRAVYENVSLSEWFEYGGKPYFFKIDIDISNIGLPESAYADILYKIQFYKNLRSHCDAICMNLKATRAVLAATAGSGIGSILKVKAKTTGKLCAKGATRNLSIWRSGTRIKVKTRKAEILTGTAPMLVYGAAGINMELKVKPALERGMYARGVEKITAGIFKANILKAKAKISEKSDQGK